MIRREAFTDRREAGAALVDPVRRLDLVDPIVLALPRGGVPVGFELAEALHAPLDVLLVRKIGAPGHEEFGIGALVDGASPQLVIDEAAARAVGASRDYIERQVKRELAEIERRRAAYCPAPPIPIRGKTVVVVDDGIATGGTVRAALQALANVGARRIVLAVPLAPRDVLAGLGTLCDDIVCLSTPEPFFAVGAHYRDFSQTEDDEVVRLLASAREWTRAQVIDRAGK
jgi:putative phosphoribosyl transferase